MIKPDQQDELTTLARARAGLSPSPADALRVRASLAAALAAPATFAPDAAPSGSGQGLGPGAGWPLRWPLRVLVTSVVVAAVGAGAGGYWLGHRAGIQEARFATVHAVTNASVGPSQPGAGAEPGATTAAPAPVADAARAREAVKRRTATARGGRPASPAESLGPEVRALRAVEHALRDNEPRLALAILQQLDRDIPKGKLNEERRATTVIARCSAGDVPFGINLAEDFASDYPGSVYLERVEQSCAPRGRHK